MRRQVAAADIDEHEQRRQHDRAFLREKGEQKQNGYRQQSCRGAGRTWIRPEKDRGHHECRAHHLRSANHVGDGFDVNGMRRGRELERFPQCVDHLVCEPVLSRSRDQVKDDFGVGC